MLWNHIQGPTGTLPIPPSSVPTDTTVQHTRPPKTFWTNLPSNSTAAERHEHARRSVCATCARVISKESRRTRHSWKRCHFWQREACGLATDIITKQLSSYQLDHNNRSVAVKLIPHVVCNICWRRLSQVALAGEKLWPFPALLEQYYNDCRVGKSGPCYICMQVNDADIATPIVLQPPRKSSEFSAAEEAAQQVSDGLKRKFKSGGKKRGRKVDQVTAPEAVAMSSRLNLTGRQLQAYMQQLKHLGVATPGKNRLDAALDLASTALLPYFTLQLTDTARSHGAYVYCSDVANFTRLIVYLSGYNIDDVAILKINADEGQQVLQVCADVFRLSRARS